MNDGGVPFCAQSLCQLDDPAAAIRGQAEQRWVAQRAAATGDSVAQVRHAAESWTGQAQARRQREVAKIMASLRREIARGSSSEIGRAHV